MNLAALVALLVLADPAPTKPTDAPTARKPLASPNARKVDEAAETKRAESIEGQMRVKRAFDGKITVEFNSKFKRIIVSLYGGSFVGGSAEGSIEDAVKAAPLLADPEISISYIFDGPCSGKRGHEIARRELGRFIEIPEPKDTGKRAGDFAGAEFVPCLEEDLGRTYR